MEAKEKKIKENKKDKKDKKNYIQGEILGKKYKIPTKALFELSKKEHKLKEKSSKIAKGEVAVMYLRNSGIAELRYVKPENDFFVVDGHYYHIDESCYYSIGKKRIPMAIIPEWSFTPLSRKAYGEVLQADSQHAQKLIIKALENAEIVKINRDDGKEKGKLNPKTAIIIVILIIVAIAVLPKFLGGGVA